MIRPEEKAVKPGERPGASQILAVRTGHCPVLTYPIIYSLKIGTDPEGRGIADEREKAASSVLIKPLF